VAKKIFGWTPTREGSIMRLTGDLPVSVDERRAVERDAELREFVAARGPALSRAAFLLTGNRDAAEDLVQETYLVMVRRWRRIDRVDPEPYVRRIMYSRFIDGWRRRRLLELPTWRLPETPSGNDEAVTSADRLTLGTALARLTPRQRAVLVLRFYEDLTEVATADVLGISPNTVKSQTRVALQRLREQAPGVIDSFEGAEQEGGAG
jgi:RNA polymerase sigma-70 factor (sigma-E family)